MPTGRLDFASVIAEVYRKAAAGNSTVSAAVISYDAFHWKQIVYPSGSFR